MKEVTLKHCVIILIKKPILGICLGMQFFADLSDEDKTNKGFGDSGKVIKFK